MSRKVDEGYYCHFELTLDIIGGKWKPIILYYLGKYGALRYSEIRRLMPKINERVLTRQLKELTTSKLIERKVVGKVPLNVEYSLVDYGKSILPILNELKQWGKVYNNEIGKLKVLTEEDRKKIIETKKTILDK